MMRRYCGSIGPDDIGHAYEFYGWVQRVRELGGLRFLVLRDREGLLQVVGDASVNREIFDLMGDLGGEDVIHVRGTVRARPEEMVNPDMTTGAVEVLAEEVTLLNSSAVPPFVVEEEVKASEELRLTYRYLDLRRPSMARNLTLRHRAALKVRNILAGKGFLEVETPTLTRSTPEGARDYLVPGRVHRGSFYALPQSPQLFKQLLMVSGVDRYFQMARCYRDEDLRADRQPEFTQIDMEMSFISEEELFGIVEEMLREVFALINYDLPVPFPKMPYPEAMESYGSDRPDLRIPLVLNDISDVFQSTEFRVFQSVLETGGSIRALHVPGANFSRKEIGELEEGVKALGMAGLAWIRWEEEPASSIRKFLSEGELSALKNKLSVNTGDFTFIGAGNPGTVLPALGWLRVRLGNQLGLVEKDIFKPVWIVDFPLVDWNEDEQRFDPLHHPFTSPRPEDEDKMESDPASVRARAYDVVINGLEIGGGSIRIHRSDLQQKMFRMIGIGEEEAREKFGFLMDAFAYGAPPHGGIALGFDRLVMILAGVSSIRDVIAFPKTTAAACLMTRAPSDVDERQLKELGIGLVKKDKPEQ